MEHIDPDLISEAENYKGAKKSNIWIKLGAIAACLCLVVGSVFAISSVANNKNALYGDDKNAVTAAGAGEDESRAGSMPDGIDPIAASVAVYPADRELSEVADATMDEINESEARATELGHHFPTTVPAGYRFKVASIYETTMKDGTKYRLLRIRYTNGDSSDTSVHPEEFSVQLTDFRPNANKTVYTVDSLPDVFVVFNVGALTHDEIMSVLRSIN